MQADKEHRIKESELRHVIRHAQIPTRPLLIAGTLLLADAGASLLTPLLAGITTARIIGPSGSFALPLNAILGLWIVLILGQALVRYAGRQHLAKTSANVSAQLRLRAYEHIQSLPIGFFHTREHGDILSLLSEDIRRISQFFTASITEIAPYLLTVVGAMVIVLYTDTVTGLISLCVMPLVLLAIRQAGRTAHPLSKALAEQQATHTSLTEENIRLIELIKSYSRETEQLQRYHTSNNNLMRAELNHLRATNRILPVIQVITGIAVIGLIWVGAERIETQTLQPAELVSLMMYGFILFRPMHGLGISFGAYQSAKGAASRLSELMLQQPEPSARTAGDFHAPVKTIRFENICYSYAGRERIIDSLTASIPAGQVTALTGENGAGKTTLLHLLLRFIAPDSGSILIDDTDIRDIDISALRRHIGYVAQNVSLVNGTIEDNIRYGLESARPDDVLRAADNALVTAFSDRLKEKMQTHVGPGGTRLSGGQKQRIALARALLKDPDILILDEPTAMFDEESESMLLSKLQKTLRGKTVIIISHRPALLDICSTTLVLRDGHLGCSEPSQHR